MYFICSGMIVRKECHADVLIWSDAFAAPAIPHAHALLHHRAMCCYHEITKYLVEHAAGAAFTCTPATALTAAQLKAGTRPCCQQATVDISFLFKFIDIALDEVRM